MNQQSYNPRQLAPPGPGQQPRPQQTGQAQQGSPFRLNYATGITQGPIVSRPHLIDLLTNARSQVAPGLSPQARASLGQYADQAWLDFGRKAAEGNVQRGLEAARMDVQGRSDLGNLAAQLYRARLNTSLPLLNLLGQYS